MTDFMILTICIALVVITLIIAVSAMITTIVESKHITYSHNEVKRLQIQANETYGLVKKLETRIKEMEQK